MPNATEADEAVNLDEFIDEALEGASADSVVAEVNFQALKARWTKRTIDPVSDSLNIPESSPLAFQAASLQVWSTTTLLPYSIVRDSSKNCCIQHVSCNPSFARLGIAEFLNLSLSGCSLDFAHLIVNKWNRI